MWFLAIGPDIHEKIEALKGSNANGDNFWVIVNWSVATVLIITLSILLTRRLFRKFGKATVTARRVGQAKNPTEDKGAVPQVIERRLPKEDPNAEDAPLRLHELLPETRVSLFWDVGELRCGCLGVVVGVEGEEVSIRFDSDSAPRKGRALLVCPEIEGHVSFYEIQVKGGPDGKTRTLASVSNRGASRMNRRYRAHVAVQAALTTVDRAECESDPIMIRIHDMAFDGLGVLSADQIRQDEKFILRVQLPGYLEPHTHEGKVAWTEKDPTGIFRAGLLLNLEDIETRLNLADFMFGRLKAESSALILEKRRDSHTSVKIPLVDLTP